MVLYTVETCEIDLGPAAPTDLGPTWADADTQYGCSFGPQS